MNALKRCDGFAILWSIIGVTSLIYIEASFWPNWDGSWHQTMVRHRAHSDAYSHVLFLLPSFGSLAVGAYIYGRFRIPALYSRDKGFPWSFFLLISAAVLECMTVAANEWGHSLWISEEIFSVPFHWPFVVYGWLASGMFAVWGETIVRLFEIERLKKPRAPTPVSPIWRPTNLRRIDSETRKVLPRRSGAWRQTQQQSGHCQAAERQNGLNQSTSEQTV